MDLEGDLLVLHGPDRVGFFAECLDSGINEFLMIALAIDARLLDFPALVVGEVVPHSVEVGQKPKRGPEFVHDWEHGLQALALGF